MKIPFLFSALFLTVSLVLGQELSFDLHTIRKPVFYRGIENSVKVISELPSDEYTVDCIGCDSLTRTNDPEVFTFVPGKRSKMVHLIILNASNKNDTLHISSTKVKPVPDPTLYHGAVRNGGRTSKNFDRLFAVYPPELNLDDLSNSFEIDRWEVGILDTIYKGTGNVLSEELMLALQKNESIKFMSVLAIVKGPDGIKRRIGGAFYF